MLQETMRSGEASLHPSAVASADQQDGMEPTKLQEASHIRTNIHVRFSTRRPGPCDNEHPQWVGQLRSAVTA